MTKSNEQISIKDQATEFLLYTAPSRKVKIEVFLQNESLWLTQRQMAELFGITPQNITFHLANIFKNEELVKESTCKEILQVQIEGAQKVKRAIEFYNLDAVIAVGYKVNSKKAAQFKIWADSNIVEKYENSVIYQAKNGAFQLHVDADKDTIWANADQIASLFGRDKSVISKHIKNIFEEKELAKKSVVAKNATTGSDGKTYQVTSYNLDLILSVGYKVNSKTATLFRKWATSILKQHITEGYTINKKALAKNRQHFLKTVEEIKLLAEDNLSTNDTINLIKAFSHTWFSLNAYDKETLPNKGKKLKIEATSLYNDLTLFKQQLIKKKEATELFAHEKKPKNLAGILGNVFQSAFGEDVYPTIEEKAAHLLYFVIKNHPFNDGNKRSGAFSFLWLLRQYQFNFTKSINPVALTALTLLIAESTPHDKEKMIGLYYF